MECTWDAALLERRDQLPPELVQVIQQGTNEQYLEALTRTALDARYTYLILAHCEDILAHSCASLLSYGSFAASVATLGRIVPFAHFLTPYATRLLESEQYRLGSSGDDGEALAYLLGLLRLLSFNHRIFRKHVRAPELTLILGRRSRPVTYLILRILQIYLHGADHWFESTFDKYLGADTSDNTITGPWDEKSIDYRFLSLWEEDRADAVWKLIAEARHVGVAQPSSSRVIPQSDFNSSVALVGRVLLPKLENVTTPSNADEELVQTETIARNLGSFAESLKSQNPILLAGLPGSGKSMLVRHAARSLGILDKMVTLHLNEQSDAKLLLGLYTTGSTPGTFEWRPGVLTTAVREGRWILIEDLDRAPNEVLGTLLPLIEKKELFIPNRKDTIYAAEGFRIIATVRSSTNHRGEEMKHLTHMLGSRHWHTVSISLPAAAEQSKIAQNLFPSLEKLLPQFLAVYERLTAVRQQSILVGQSKTGVARAITPRELLKWCQRVSRLLGNRGIFTSTDVDKIYLEAIDCFVGSLPDDYARQALTASVAEELHIDPQRRDYLLTSREVQYKTDNENIIVGRYTLCKARHVKNSDSSFSTNPHTSRMLERVAAAVCNREPLLLVGETGVGKTTAVQHLANHLGRKLVPFNLSQQSEAGDLLGGFKPVNARMLIVPMKDEFDDLFSESFSASKNKQFIDLLGKQMAKSNWKAVCKLWRQALSMVDQQRAASPPPREGEAPSKKRRVDTKRVIDFGKWDVFASKVETIERQLANGDNAFAFSFVEGNIVKAVRNGDWVLLDEINLASLDTLEALADLLDPESPSLLLTEAGDIERIDASPSFRVFAAMNPATDVGKKDLPPGIRSRFTEIYVEGPDKDLKSLCSIVAAYLRQESTADAALPSDVSSLYQKIIGFAEDNKLVDGAGQKPHFSLRTLTRTLSYAKNIQQMCSPRRALYEGFHMSFLTFLDAESSALLQPAIEQHLFGKRINVQAELSKALRKPKDGRPYVQGYPDSKDNRYQNTKHWIRQGSEERQDQTHYIITPFVRNNLENLVRATSTRQFPVLIQGPTSSGKTSMIEYLAKRTGHKFTRINNHEHTDLQEYLGTYVSGTDGRLQFQEGVLVKALREGHWIVLDELNLAPTDVLEALNRLLDDNRELLVPETQEVIRPHPDFMLFATQNPAGLYGGRKTLSRAFRNRFLDLHFDDIPVHELEDILHRRTQLPKTWAKRIVTVYRELSLLRQENRLFEQKSFATLRDLFRWAMRPNETIEQLATNGYMLLCERVRKQEERVALKAILEKAMSEKGPKVRIDEESLYSESSPEVQEHRINSTQRGVVWTSAMRRLYVLVSRAIQNNEPVLLVGETGCGKTTVCQMLADALRKDLQIINAHQNTETGDLIGSQRPVRNRAGIETALREKLLQQISDQQSASTDELLVEYDKVVAAMRKGGDAAYSQSPAHVEIQALRTSFRALFEWSDGSLVHAMRNGNFFLLDEISLADDSVLERINSVLESQRTILLAEKGSLDSSITAADGFQFFATMNPGGDYGKRELSPALRNRFTEIWVPALSDLDDVLHIVRDKLVESAQPHAAAMVSFAAWFKNRFDTSASSSVSIRDTLAWVQFVNAFAGIDVTSAVVHGAAMVYIDTLGANPAGLMSVSSQDIAEERTACLDKLDTLLAVDANATYGQSLTLSSDNTRFGIGPFTIARDLSAQSTDLAFSFDPPTTRLNSMRVLRALQLSKPVMLEGSPGVGKTALVTAIAAAAGVPLTRINLSDQTDLLDLFGSDAPVEGAQAGTFVWRDAPFLRAMKKGEWVLLDEMNLAAQSVLEGLNACLDHRESVFVPELGQTFTRHPNFRLFAAQNPHHQGGGRKGLPASFVNRFTVVFVDSFKPEDLKMISHSMFPALDTNETDRAVAFVSKLDDEVAHRRKFGASGSPWEFNLRDIARWLSLASSGEALLRAGTARDFVNSMFLQRFRTTQDRTCVSELFASVFDPATPAADMFCNISTQTLQVGLGLLPRHASTSSTRNFGHGTLSQQHVLSTVMICIQQAWPVLLVGSASSGKTSLIERLAAAVGADLTTLAMSAETDALDLIGGYEQFDPHRETSQALKQLQERCDQLAKHGLFSGSTAEVAELIEAVNQLEAQVDPATLSKLAQTIPPEAISDFRPLLDRLQRSEANIDKANIDKARFEWIDGPLIDALQKGKWLVLDNANLCSPSVLDRLNSLLEPNGALIINEHSAPDGSPQVLRPHPRFRIFLTVDPRLGELSRAMRNRAVELFMMPGDNVASSTDGLYTESAMARFRAFKTSGMGEDDVKVTLDHLAQSDRALISRLLEQFAGGLFISSTSNAPDLRPLAALVAGEPSLKPFYEDVSSSMQVPADFACVQTFHPLNNQPLVRRSQQSYHQALALAAQYDLSISFRSVTNTLAIFKASRKRSERLARSWKTIRQEIKSIGKRNSTPLDLINGLLRKIQSGFQPGLASSLEQLGQVKMTTQMMLAYCSTLLHALDSDTLDAATLTACILVGHGLFSAHIPESLPNLKSLTLQGKQLLSDFDSEASRGVGQTHVALWKTLKPHMPTMIGDLHAVLAFEDVVSHFDDEMSSIRLPTEQVVDLRLAFQQALKLGFAADSKLNQLAEQARALIPATPTIEDYDSPSTPTRPHFASAFEALCQHFAILSLTNIELQPSESVLMETLALRKTTTSIQLSTVSEESPRSKIRLLGLSLPQSAHEADNEDVESSITRRLASVDQVCLGDMSRLEAETTALGQIVGSKAHLIQTESLPILDIALRDLHQGILSSLPELNLGEASKYFELLARYLESNSTHSPLQASQAWMAFALACILMYIPDRAFDPVQEAQFRKAVHQRVKDDVQSRLQALLSFKEAWFGQRDSLRSRILQEEHVALGPGPDIVEICRPTDSQLMQLHGEFLNLLRLLQPVQKSKPSQLSPDLLDAHAWENMKVLRARLKSRQYRPYGDLVTPVIGFIDCLFVAQSLHLRATVKQGTEGQTVSLARIMPLVGASSSDWMSNTFFVQVQQTYRSREEQIFWLSVVATRSGSYPTSRQPPELQTAIDETFRSFYEAWKIELSRDQKLNAAKSSLYKYRGGDDCEDEENQEELEELFPTWEAQEGPRDGQSNPALSAQTLAPKMAKLYHTIYSADSKSQDQILALLDQWMALSVAHPHIPPGFASIFRGLDKLGASLKSTSKEPRSINIYQHAHIDQSKILVALIKNIQNRFNMIHTAWPEHATPIEVLRACDQVLALGHAEPLARYFPSVEKLHGTINEWQKVASSEFSASGLLDETTDLIISWRRLELSTWAGMFDSEDKQCAQNAASWWFIAYEAIIRASDDPKTSQQASEKFAQDLLETLGSFLSACGLGEYRLRLNMFRDFQAALATRSSDQNAFTIVRSALASFISFYARFESAVAEQLANKRAALEKDIKNVIQLASWKDRNIETLRQSAKTSHKKLFRIVRKYRQALGESVTPILQAEFPYIKSTVDSSDTAVWVRIFDEIEQSSNVVAQFQPLQDLLATIRQMKDKSDATRKSATAAKRIDKFLQDLDDETVELRKATPNVLTEENKTLVQHLKTRKRRLLADVLRDVRLMGFQTNISDSVLEQQLSLPMVLANTSPLANHGVLTGLDAADQEFHRLLHIMPSVRAGAVKHSEDLTPAEVARSKVLIESMLQESIEQRRLLASQMQSLSTFDSALKQIDGLATSDNVNVLEQVSDPRSTLIAQITTLLQILRSSLSCVEMQGRICGHDFSSAVERLSKSAQSLETIRGEVEFLRPLPQHVSSTSLDTLHKKYADLIGDVKETICEETQIHPELGPLLSQIAEWTLETPPTSYLPSTGPGTAPTVSNWLENLASLTKRTSESAVTRNSAMINGHDKKMWLFEQQRGLTSSVENLQLRDISHKLIELMDNLHRVKTVRPEDFSQVVLACKIIAPILRAYNTAADALIHEMATLHATTSRMAHRLATSFVQLTSQGFCTPPDKAQNEEQQSGKAEAGTGLGKGEGAEDISKDIGDDEDLGELAQEANSKDQKDETEAEKDAVDMADEDLEGNFDEDAGSEDNDENGSEDGQSDTDINEEAGHVDADDAEAKDEKTWNDKKEAGEAEKEAEGTNGTKSEDLSAAADNAKEGVEDGPEEESQELDDEADASAENEQEVDHHDPEKADAHMNGEENLDLPDDINMDGNKNDVDDTSDAGSDLAEEMDDFGNDQQDDVRPEDKNVEMGEEDNGEEGEENGEATMEYKDEEVQDQGDDANSDVAMLDNPKTEDEPAEGQVSADDGQGQDQDDTSQANGALGGHDQLENENDMNDPSTESGTAKGGNKTQQDTSSGQAEPGAEDQQSLPYKQLGDVLKEWYNQHRDIESAKESAEEPENQKGEELDQDDPRFEHTDDADVEMQALGAAKAEQSRALDDKNAMPIEQEEDNTDAAKPVNEEDEDLLDQQLEDEGEGAGASSNAAEAVEQTSKAMIGRPTEVDLDMHNAMEETEEQNMDDMDEQLTNTHLSQDEKSLMSIEEARKAWSEHESRTRNMAVVLTEHLRLILQPTQATKMRGDFRTGKRLNIKKIIPYIASSYKRDKIWMRRSIPSKRSYQIMLAIDDSESMNESERKGLAFDTLALVAKSMAMLEVGELCIIGFGETVNVNHDFSMPFTSDAGAEVFRHFSFSQSKTDVRRLLEQSIELFRTARLKATGSGSNLWQLQLIISDGLCEDHPSIRQLVRQAHEEQIMIVFIVVDATAQQTGAVATKQSIMDLQRAEFKDGDVKMVKYLDNFPFRYYLIVRDVLELPAVLAGALRQWFAEVVDTGN